MHMIRTLAIAAAFAAMSVPAFAQTTAGVPVERMPARTFTDGEHAAYEAIPGFSVLLTPPPYSAPAGSMHAILCDRTSIFIGPNDHRVITDFGVPLFISNSGRIAILEIVDRQLRLRFTRGEPTPAEQAAIGPAIERATNEINALPPRQAR